jgi:acyl dehydratase
LKLFSEAIQDKYAAHKAESASATFYRADIVYGIFTSAMFTSIFRTAFPKGIYMSQDLKFRKPVLRNELVKGRV